MWPSLLWIHWLLLVPCSLPKYIYREVLVSYSLLTITISCFPSVQSHSSIRVSDPLPSTSMVPPANVLQCCPLCWSPSSIWPLTSLSTTPLRRGTRSGCQQRWRTPSTQTLNLPIQRMKWTLCPKLTPVTKTMAAMKHCLPWPLRHVRGTLQCPHPSSNYGRAISPSILSLLAFLWCGHGQPQSVYHIPRDLWIFFHWHGLYTHEDLQVFLHQGVAQ